MVKARKHKHKLKKKGIRKSKRIDRRKRKRVYMSEAMDEFIEGMMNKCTRLYDKGKGDEALQCLVDTEKKYKSKEVSYQKGLYQIVLDKCDDAIKTFDALIQSEPSNPKYYEGKGLCFMKQGKNEDAIKQFRIALKLDPNNTEAGIFAAICMNPDKQAESDALLEKATITSPSKTAKLLKANIEGILKNSDITDEQRVELIAASASIDKSLQRLLETEQKVIERKNKKRK